MADLGIPVSEATSGTLRDVDMKQTTNGLSQTVYQQRIVIAADETTGPGGSSDTDAFYIRQARGALTTGQVSVTTTATAIKLAVTGRIGITIVNTGAVTVFLGTSGVTATTGHALPAGAAFSTDEYAGDIYGITASSTATVTFAALA